MRYVPRLSIPLLIAITLGTQVMVSGAREQAPTYQDLVALFDEFLEFERPPLKDGAPDYTAATLARKATRLKTFQTRLAAINPSSWPVDQQVDHALVGRADERPRLRSARAAAVGPGSSVLQIRLDGPERHAGARGADAPCARRAVDLRVPAVGSRPVEACRASSAASRRCSLRPVRI